MDGFIASLKKGTVQPEPCEGIQNPPIDLDGVSLTRRLSV
jgi:hypothetical protein